MLRAMGASVVAMVMMLIIGPAFIRWLRLNEFGQNIREDGPAGHLTKEGTPTMGGVLIWFAVVIPFLIFSRFSVASITVMIAALGNAFIGFIDDWIKIVRKRSLGLAARYKLLLQLVLALFIGFVAIHFVGLDTRVEAVWLLGAAGKLTYSQTAEGLSIKVPKAPFDSPAYAFKLTFSGQIPTLNP